MEKTLEEKPMHVQISNANRIIRKALAEHGEGLCAGAVISALDRVSHDLKEISLWTTDANAAIQKYDISPHGEVIERR